MTIAIICNKKTNKIPKNNIIEITLDDLESYGNFRHGMEFVNFPSYVISNKTIMEWFAVDDISYWWFAAPILHPKYNEAVLFIKRLSSFLDEHSIHLIQLKGAFNKIDLVKQIAKQKNIKLDISNEYILYRTKNKIKKLAKKSIYKNFTKEKINKRNNIFESSSSFKGQLNNPIIFTSPDIYRRETYDFILKQPKKEEFFIKPFLDAAIKNKIPTLCFDLDYTLKGSTNILEERLNTNVNWIPIEFLLQKSKSEVTKNIISSLKNSVEKLLKNGKNEILSFQNISLTEHLKQDFEDLFLEPNLPTYIHLIDLLEDYLQKIKPKAIIQVYETGTYAKAFEVAAKKLKIKTIGIQHGLIPTDYPDYMFKEIQNEHFPLGNFIPDKTLVFGEYYKKILTEIGGYPKEKIQVLGNPTYFDFEKIKNCLDKNEILKRNDFNNEKIILVPLSMRFFYFENSPDRIILNMLFNGFKDQDDVKILIRPHPGDKLDQNILANFFPGNNFRISKNTLFEDIFISDVVVVLPISSVSSEVPIFEKPLLLVNVEKDNSIKSIDEAYLQLVEYDVAKLIPSSEIALTINSIDKGEIWENNYSQKRKEFLEYYFNYGNTINLLDLIK
jgi:hypothetical protein